MLKKNKTVISLVISSVVLISVISILTVKHYVKCIEIDPVKYSEQTYELQSGKTARNVADDLLDGKLKIFIAKIYLRFHSEFSLVQKGTYLIDGSKSFTDLLSDMVEGNIVVKNYPSFTVVEGTNLAKTVLKIQRTVAGSADDSRFFNLVSKPDDFVRSVLSEHPDLYVFITHGSRLTVLEGLLNPATYPLYEHDPLYNLFKQGIVRQLKILKREWDKRESSDNIRTPYEALILASLIESETTLEDEKPQVAAVFENRLTKKMKLQTDPSVMYGVSQTFKGTLSKSQLKRDTAYNTYTRQGLPPTPICMPQQSSIHAALHPAKIKALYFVAKGISPLEGHNFSETLDEHNKAVSEYKKKVASYKQGMKDSSDSEVKTTVSGDVVTIQIDQPDKASKKKTSGSDKSPKSKNQSSSKSADRSKKK